jgi:hypothetical protein
VTTAAEGAIARILRSHEEAILDEWIRDQMTAFRQGGRISEKELRAQSTEFL